MRRWFVFIVLLLMTGPMWSMELVPSTQIAQDSLQVDTAPLEPTRFEDAFKEKYAGNEYIYERNIDTEGWFTRFKRWLGEVLQSWFDLKSDTQTNDLTSLIINLIYILVIIAVIFVIVRAIMNGEGRWVFGRSSDKNIIPVEDLEQSLHVIDFQKEIAALKAEGKYRMAIRYYYLFILKKLSDAELISFDVEKTNNDYLRELQNSNVGESFAHASYLYNYIWYGEFPIDGEAYGKAQVPFENLLNQIKR